MSSVQYFENDNTTFLCCTYEIYTNNQIAERFCQNLKERVSGLKVKKKTKIFVKPKNYLPFTKIRIKNPQEQLLSIFKIPKYFFRINNFNT